MDILDFYKGKRVFVTGHTGFKGSWLSAILQMAGAEVTGYALNAPTKPSLFELLGLSNDINSVTGDIRDFCVLKKAFDEAKPEIVFHLAAQPIVLDGYREPRETYEINTMGTVNILECIRLFEHVKSFINVTTDKVYENKDGMHSFAENDILCGSDPYSNSKSCSELITRSYRDSFFSDRKTAISAVRAGNAIGGGDFAPYRIIPDCMRSVMEGKEIVIRNPKSVRPYQHVLEPIYMYLHIAAAQYMSYEVSGEYNIGPDESDYVSTERLVEIFCEKWGGGSWKTEPQKNAPNELQTLKIDCSKAKSVFGWEPKYSIDEAAEKTVEWIKAYRSGENMRIITKRQIEDYLTLYSEGKTYSPNL